MPIELRTHVFFIPMKQGAPQKAEVIKLQIFLNWYIGANYLPPEHSARLLQMQ
jgi:hypothetical protein